TQYLRPSKLHHPIDRWVKPEEFVELAAEAEEIGFAGVMSGPLVRSSYRAGRLYRQAAAKRGLAVAAKLGAVSRPGPRPSRTRGRPGDKGGKVIKLKRRPTAAVSRPLVRSPYPGSMAKKPKETKTPQATDAAGQKKPGRFKQIGMVAKVVHQQSPKSIPIAVAIFVGIVALSVVGAVLTGGWLYWMSLGIPIGFLAGFIFFTRSAQKIQYKMLDGQLGAGMAVLENMRGDWTVDPGVGATRQMDVVHRVVGRPGIVLVGEGDPNRLRKVIGAEK